MLCKAIKKHGRLCSQGGRVRFSDMTDLFVVQAAVEYHCQRYGGDLRNEEAEPHGVQPAELGKHKSAGQKQQQLAHRAHDQAEHAVAQCLEYTGKYDGHARRSKS